MTQGDGKVFGIGISRTGSKTLTQALEILGFRTHFVVSYDDFEHSITEFDAFTHTPMAAIYPELDRRFPGSRFILLLRNREEWLRSCEKQFAASKGWETPEQLEIRRKVYGITYFDRDTFSLAFDRHVENVSRHFRDRSHALLSIDVCGGEAWETLCPFLNLPIPKEPFPHANIGRETFGRPSQILKRFAQRHLKATEIKRLWKQTVGR